MKNLVLHIIISILLCSGLTAIAYYLGARHGISRLKRYKNNLTEAVDNLKSTTVEETINIDCDGIFKYKALARKENNPTEYNVAAEIMVYTSTNRAYGLSQMPKKTYKEISYHLHYIHWTDGSTAFINKNEADKYSAPQLILNRETKVISAEGKTYYITLSSEIIPIELEEIEAFRKSVYKRINKMLDNATYQHKYFARIISDYRKHLNLRVAEELEKKRHPAPRASEEVRRLTRELKRVDEKYTNLKYKLNMYGIKNIDDITLEDAKYLQAAQKYLRRKNTTEQ